VVIEDRFQESSEESEEVQVTSEIQKDITTLARKCLKAGIPIRIACEKLCKAMQDEMFRTLIEAPGLVKKEK
jgi:hypothetical protein